MGRELLLGGKPYKLHVMPAAGGCEYSERDSLIHLDGRNSLDGQVAGRMWRGKEGYQGAGTGASRLNMGI